LQSFVALPDARQIPSNFAPQTIKPVGVGGAAIPFTAGFMARAKMAL
jgi:hypothetical protein